MSITWRRHLSALGLYALLSLLLTLPLALHFTTRVAGDGIDDPALAWNLWWIKHSLVDQPQNPFLSRWMFYPIGINLAFYTLTPLNGLLSIPLQSAWNLVPAVNLSLLSSFILGGYGTYLLALTMMGRGRHAHRAALLAGLFYAFASSKLFYASLGQYNIASSQWVPFAMLYAVRSTRPRARLREPWLAALFLLLQAYAELTYASFLVIFIGLLALGRGAQTLRSRQPALLLPLARNLTVMAVVFLVGLTPVLAAMLPDLRAEGDFMVEGDGFADIYSADLAGFTLPTQLHPLLGNAIRTLSAQAAAQPPDQWPVDKGQHITLGWIGLALALSGIVAGRRRGAAFWAAAALLFFLLALGPSLRIAGYDTGLPGPFRILQTLPFFKGNRYPSRFSVMLLATLTPLVAWGTQALLRRLASDRVRIITPLLAGLLLFENLSVPLPTATTRIPTIYDLIAADPAPGVVLDLPLGWRNGFNVFGKQDLVIMAEQWAQTRHERPILGGNTSRNPEYKFNYFLEAPLIGPLTVLANAVPANPHIMEQMHPALAGLDGNAPTLESSPLLQQAADDAPRVLQALNVRYVVIHTDSVPAQFVTFVEHFLPVTFVTADGAHRLYRVQAAPLPTTLTVHPATDALSRGEGWSQPGDRATLWAQRQNTHLLLPPLDPAATSITVRARAAGPGQTLALQADGSTTAAQPLPETWTELRFTLHAELNAVALRFSQVYPVQPAPVSLAVTSAGLDAGSYAHIWLNGVDLAPNSRGYNLAIIDAATWQPRAVAVFDTHADPAASAALVAFLQQFDTDSLLALAIKDSAGAQLSDEAAAALAAVGLDPLQGRLRWSQAAIVPGQTLLDAGWTRQQQVNGLQSVRVSVGPAWSEPTAAAEVEWLRVER
ncbi:MAG: interleukin-like EMT inducer domain-containing protein [Anaerolineae bacterium]